MERLSNKEGQLVSVLTRGGDSDGSLPIIVQMTQLVGQSLQLIRGKSALVEDDIVRHRSDRTLPDALRNQEEVVAEIQHFPQSSSTLQSQKLTVPSV